MAANQSETDRSVKMSRRRLGSYLAGAALFGIGFDQIFLKPGQPKPVTTPTVARSTALATPRSYDQGQGTPSPVVTKEPPVVPSPTMNGPQSAAASVTASAKETAAVQASRTAALPSPSVSPARPAVTPSPDMSPSPNATKVVDHGPVSTPEQRSAFITEVMNKHGIDLKLCDRLANNSIEEVIWDKDNALLPRQDSPKVKTAADTVRSTLGSGPNAAALARVLDAVLRLPYDKGVEELKKSENLELLPEVTLNNLEPIYKGLYIFAQNPGNDQGVNGYFTLMGGIKNYQMVSHGEVTGKGSRKFAYDFRENNQKISVFAVKGLEPLN